MSLFHVFFIGYKSYIFIWLLFLAMAVANFIFMSPLFAFFFLASIGSAFFLQMWCISHSRKWHVYTKVMPVKLNHVVLTWYLCFAVMLCAGVVVTLVAVWIGSFFVETGRYIPIVLYVALMWMTFISFYIPIYLVHRSELSKARYVFLEILLIPLPFLQMILIIGGFGRAGVLLFAGDEPMYQILSYAASGTAFFMYMAVSILLFIASIAVSIALYKKIDF